MNIEIYKTSILSSIFFENLCLEIQPIFVEFSPSGHNLLTIKNKFTKKPNQYLMVARENNSIVGFCSFYETNQYGLRVMNFSGTVISQPFHSQGLFKELIKKGINCIHADVLVTCSQNPRVYESLRKFTCSIIPDILTPYNYDQKLLCIMLEHCKRDSFDDNTIGLLKNYYSRDNIAGDSRTTRSGLSQKIFTVLGDKDAIVVGGVVKKSLTTA